MPSGIFVLGGVAAGCDLPVATYRYLLLPARLRLLSPAACSLETLCAQWTLGLAFLSRQILLFAVGVRKRISFSLSNDVP